MSEAAAGKRAGPFCVNTSVMLQPRKEAAVPEPLTMYTTPWCGFCKRLKAQLGREGIEMREVDIEADPSAADYVMSVNGGNQTVPTVVFPDGSAMTNPSAAQVKARLAELAAI
jgi:mycoredoxin